MPLSCTVGGGEIGTNITPLVDRLRAVVIQYFIFICCLALHYSAALHLSNPLGHHL